MNRLTESEVRVIVKQELLYKKALDEGVWDDVKSGAKKMIAAVTKKVGSMDIIGNVKEALSQFAKMPDGLNTVMSALKDAMKETGEQIPLDDTLKSAKEFGKIDVNSATSDLADDLEGPVHDKAKQLSNEGAYHTGLLPILTEIHRGAKLVKADNKKFKKLRESRNLNEAGLLSFVGLGLASFGGTIMLLRGLEKLANWLGAAKTAKLLHKAAHFLHELEEKAIDWIIPDALSFAIYNVLYKRGFRAQNKLKRALNKEEYVANTGGAKMKVEKLLYSALLVFFAWNGIKAALNAGISLLGFAEGTATMVKGVEIGHAAASISDIVELGIED